MGGSTHLPTRSLVTGGLSYPSPAKVEEPELGYPIRSYKVTSTYWLSHQRLTPGRPGPSSGHWIPLVHHW